MRPILDYHTLPEPPNLSIRQGNPHWTVEIDGRTIPVISMRLDETAQPPLMPVWLFLRTSPSHTILLHTCGNGSGWHEVDEGAQQFSIRSGKSSQDYMIFTCLKCSSQHRMRPDGSIEWEGMEVDY